MQIIAIVINVIIASIYYIPTKQINMTPLDQFIAFGLGAAIIIGFIIIVYILKKIIQFKGEAVILPEYKGSGPSSIY